jgi:hypothetical protein
VPVDSLLLCYYQTLQTLLLLLLLLLLSLFPLFTTSMEEAVGEPTASFRRIGEPPVNEQRYRSPVAICINIVRRTQHVTLQSNVTWRLV